MAGNDDINRLIDQLDHPDPNFRRDAMDELLEKGREHVDQVAANLPLVDRRARVPLIQVLDELGDRRALLALMRFVFDTRGQTKESDARALAMKAIAGLASEADGRRVFDFLLDVRDDDDAFVRGYAAQAFASLGDRRALPFLDAALDDDDEFVRQKAANAKASLEDASGQALRADQEADTLLREIRGASGARLTFYLNAVRERDDAFELAAQLVREGGRRSLRGLELLSEIADPRGRAVAVDHIDQTASDADRAASLRLLADLLEGDANADEQRVISQGLGNRDQFVWLAALEAAGASGSASLVRQALEALQRISANDAASVAAALARTATATLRPVLPTVFDALGVVRGRLRLESEIHAARAEGYLLRALRKLVEAGTPAASRARAEALESLRHSGDQLPVVVTGLELLDKLTDAGRHDRPLHPADAAALVELLDHRREDVRRRAAHVLSRGAPGDTPGLAEMLERLLSADAQRLRDEVIPVLRGARPRQAATWLDELAGHPDPGVAREAAAARRLLRTDEPHVDVDFEKLD